MKNTNFLLAALLSIMQVTNSIENQGSQATVESAKSTVAETAPTITQLLTMTKKALIAHPSSTQEEAVVQKEVLDFIEQTENTLSDIVHQNEHSKEFINDFDTLLADLIKLHPQAKKLYDNGALFAHDVIALPSVRKLAHQALSAQHKIETFNNPMLATLRKHEQEELHRKLDAAFNKAIDSTKPKTLAELQRR